MKKAFIKKTVNYSWVTVVIILNDYNKLQALKRSAIVDTASTATATVLTVVFTVSSISLTPVVVGSEGFGLVR